MAASQRFQTLDAMRGCAALLVALYHIGDATGIRLVRSGNLTVDFFFALSGLVLARAYSTELRDGASPLAFMEQRVLRLYPLFLIGIGFGLLKTLGQIAAGTPDAPGWGELGLSLVLQVLMLPAPSGTGVLYPLNGPAWSLFFELAINLVFALWLATMRTRALVLVAALAAAGVLATARAHGSLDVGGTWATAWGGVPRVAFGFCIGILIHRAGFRPKRVSLAFLVPILLLTALTLVPVAPIFRPAFDVVAALVVIPALVMLGATIQPNRRMSGLCRTLGEISYPLYVIHLPLLMMARFAAERMGLSLWLWVPAALAVVTGLAFLLGRTADPWIRRRLRPAVLARGEPGMGQGRSDGAVRP